VIEDASYALEVVRHQRSILSFAGNYVSDATARLLDITLIARNQMNVCMGYGLSCCHPTVDADIEACRVVSLGNVILHVSQQVEAGYIALLGQVEDAGDVCFWNYQRVALRDRAPVLD
jgi:hypothetical protein